MFLYWFLTFIWNAHGEYGSVTFTLETLGTQFLSNLLSTTPQTSNRSRGSKGEQKLTLQMFVSLDSISLSSGARLAHGSD